MAKWSEQHNGKFPDPFSKLKLDEEKKEPKKKKKKKRLIMQHQKLPVGSPGSAVGLQQQKIDANGKVELNTITFINLYFIAH